MAAAIRKMVVPTGAKKSNCGNKVRSIGDSIAYFACLPVGRYSVLRMETAVLLHNVRSTHNVGSIFRTADAAGVEKIYLTGYTPTPIDGFGRIQKDIAKTALGAEHYLSWEYARSPVPLIRRLHKEGWTIVGVEQDLRSVGYRTYKAKNKTLFIFGNEVRGMSKQIRDICDVLVEIPMRGKKESLNVSVVAGIILFVCMA
jgi:23S rRNA (guanosine2251-2'-O)-methyltransferase